MNPHEFWELLSKVSRLQPGQAIEFPRFGDIKITEEDADRILSNIIGSAYEFRYYKNLSGNHFISEQNI